MLSIFFLFTFINTERKKLKRKGKTSFIKLFTQWKIFNEHSSLI